MHTPLTPEQARIFPVYFTPEEVAIGLSVTRRTVYEWLLSGRLKASKSGSRWHITQKQLDSFLAYSSPQKPDPKPDPKPSDSPSAPKKRSGIASKRRR